MRPKAAVLAAALLLVLSACGGADDSATSESGGFDDATATTSASAEPMSGPAVEVSGVEDTMEEAAVDQASDAEIAGDAGAPVAGQAQTEPEPAPDGASDESGPVDTGRDIIRTATVTAEVPDVSAAAQEVINSVERVGGLLFNQDTRIGRSNQANRTTLVFRVPPADFQRVLSDLDGVGTLLDKQVDATDVTGRVVDLRSRITSTELSVERLRGFLAGATDLTQIATFENELRNRETDLETLRGQLRTLENQVALSTITITLVEKVPPRPPTPAIRLVTSLYSGHDAGFSCGAESGRIETGDDVTICYQVTNTGETALDNLNLRDNALDLSLEQLTVVEGDPADVLQPGERILLAHEFTAETSRVITRAKVQADAIPAAGATETEVFEDTVSGSTNITVNVQPKQTPPGFSDGLSTGWEGLLGLIRVVMVLVGLALPFIWVVPLMVLGYRAWRRRKEERMQRIFPPAPQPPKAPEIPDEPVEHEPVS